MQLIDIGPTVGYPNIIPPEWTHISKMMEGNIKYVKAFYNNSGMAVRSNHILAELVKNFNIPFVLEIDRYHQLLMGKAIRNASNLGLTTAYGAGKIFREQFFKNNAEIIIGHDEDFDYINGYKNWRELEPATVLFHKETNLDLPILDGNNFSSGEEVYVVSVNMVMLGIMYKGFIEHELSLNLPTQKSIMQFIKMYVLPGMIRSYLNLSLFNRLFNFKIGIKPPKIEKNTHSFYIPSKLDSRIDFILKVVLIALEKKELYLSGIFASIPKFETNPFVITDLPDTLINRQQLWALLYSKIDIFINLFEVGNKTTVYNKTYLNEMKRMIEIFIGNNEHNTIMPFMSNISFKGKLDYLLSL